jgi:lipopolysaccharide export system permease protein
MITLDRYLVKQFFPVFISALALFMMMILLLDMFLNLSRYLANGAAFTTVLKVSLFYIPKSASYALPVSLLFASAYTLGDLSAKNELVTILGSGMPYWRFCLSLIAIGVLASFFAFFFEDRAVVPTLKVKNQMSRELLKTSSESLSNIVVKAEEGRLIYSVDYYDSNSVSLIGVTIIELDENNRLVSMVFSSKAIWEGTSWTFTNPILYRWDNGFLRPTSNVETARYHEDPGTFRRSAVSPADLNARDTALLIKDLKKAGLPVTKALADYHHRFSFSAVSFIVIFLSLTVSGKFKKNILLLSLLASLGTAVIFYVIEMITMMAAREGLLPPFMGAWIPVFVCSIAAGFILVFKT